MRRDEFFNHDVQREWNKTRIAKLTVILGVDWFAGKKILEVGAGHGENGKALMELGATVTFTDGRDLHVNFLKEDGFDAHVMDQDKPWTIEGSFDLIIHWGVLYHLDNWKQDLSCALEHSSLICLETEIHGSADPLFEEKKKEDKDYYDQALNTTGTLVSSRHLENYLTSLGANFIRYDDKDLDALPVGNYSWNEMDTPGFQSGQRRFWIIRR